MSEAYRFRTFGAFAALILAMLAAVFLTTSVYAQSGEIYPSAPTNVSVTASNTQALITWESGGSGVNGTCATEYYYVRVYDMGAAGFPIHEESEYIPQPNSGNPSWHVDELKAGTQYYAEIYAVGDTCDNSSDTAGTYKFLTSSTTVSNPSAPSGNKQKLPRRIRNLNVTHSGTTATATWRAALPSDSAKRCRTKAVDEQLHTWFLENLTTGETVRFGDVADQENVSVSLTGLVSGNRYMVSVEHYSWECDVWSPQRRFKWTQ